MRLRSALLAAPLLAALACADDSPTSTDIAASARRDAVTCRPTDVTGAITKLYPPKDRGATLQRFQHARVRAQQGDVDGAWPDFLAIAGDAIARQRAGTLLQPNGTTIADAVVSLVDVLYVCGGRTPVGDVLGPILENGTDVAITPVAPGTPTQLVVPSRNFGVVDPEANFFDEPALLIIERVPDDPPFVPAEYVEHPPRFKATVLPATAQANFGTTPVAGAPTILVIICPGEPHPSLASMDVLRIPDAFPAEPAQRLETSEVQGYGVTCTEAGEYPAPQQVGAMTWFGARMFGAIRRGAATARGWLAPQVAYAVDGGIGGETFFMSSFVAVSDPTPPPPPEVVVVNDANIFDDDGMASAGNRQFVRNLVALEPGAARLQGTRVIFDRGRNAPCFVLLNEVCRDDKIMTFTAEIALLGYTLTKVNGVESYAAVPSDVRTIFFANPTVAFTPSDVAGLRAFAEEGGRLIVIGEHAGFYGATGLAVENALLSALGAQIQSAGDVIDCLRTTLPASSIVPHATTAGVSSLSVACMSTVVPGPSDATTLLSVDGTHVVGGVGRLDLPPIAVERRQGGGAAPNVRREGVRPSGAAPVRTMDSRGNPIAPR